MVAGDAGMHSGLCIYIRRLQGRVSQSADTKAQAALETDSSSKATWAFFHSPLSYRTHLEQLQASVKFSQTFF